ncbi:MAG: hypothetical protein L6R35_002042 [Caloplaca aegaea]|nr:MAG: hypothetical protein L6R35_002042 [Caloplaca aegaea]
MASSTLTALVTVESDPSPQIRNPPAAVVKKPTKPIRLPPPLVQQQELHDLSLGHAHHHQQQQHPHASTSPSTPSGGDVQTPITPITPNELESSRPASPRNGEGGGEEEAAQAARQTLSNPPTNRWRFLSACLMCFANGLNDSAPGALIPYLEKGYEIGYAVVSLIFITNACYAAFAGEVGEREHVDRCAVDDVGGIVSIDADLMIVGLGEAINLALNNTFCANLGGYATALGTFHGSYGIGGTVGPLMATGLVSTGSKWSTFYWIPIALTFLNICMAFWAYRHYEVDNPSRHNALLRTPSGQRTSKSELLKRALRNKVTLLGSFFIFAYQGAEVSISGWVISFLITYRNGDPSRVGYVTAGFWAGITLGRFVLTHPAHRIGEKIAVVGLIVGAILFQLLVWFVPNVVGESVAVSIEYPDEQSVDRERFGE